MNKSKSGFTIVELLIVIVIIAILAAITVVAYNGVQNRASDSAIQSNVRNFASKVQEYNATEGKYPAGGITGPTAGMAGFSLAKSSYATNVHNFIYCRGIVGGVDTFAVGAMSKSGKIFVYYSSGGLKQYTGSWYSGVIASVCPALGVPTDSPSYSFTYGYNMDGTWFNWTT